MQIELRGEVDEKEVETARNGLEQLRAAVQAVKHSSSVVTIGTGTRRVVLAADALDSAVKIVQAVIAGSMGEREAEVSPQEAAEILRMSRPSVMRLIAEGYLHARMVGTHHRLSKAEVVAYMERQTRVRRDAMRNLTDLVDEYDF